MLDRCTNPSNQDYRNYGNRGIIVCEEWKSFEYFFKDMGEVSTAKHTLDRIDNNKGYCKLNCRWATQTQQNRNSRHNHLITHNGKTQCLAAWAEKYQIPYATLLARINTLGWPIGKALITPVRKRQKESHGDKITERWYSKIAP